MNKELLNQYEVAFIKELFRGTLRYEAQGGGMAEYLSNLGEYEDGIQEALEKVDFFINKNTGDPLLIQEMEAHHYNSVWANFDYQNAYISYEFGGTEHTYSQRLPLQDFKDILLMWKGFIQSIQKPAILSFIDWYEPAYKAGGPVRSMVNLTELLKEEVSFFIVCGNKEIDGEFLPVQSNKWIVRKKSGEVYYCSRPKLSLLKSWKKQNPKGVFHINGVYSFRFSVLPLLFARFFFPKTKTVVSPRGMLNEGALKIKSGKKKLFLTCARLLGLFKNVTWHATSQEEKDRIKKVFPQARDIHVLFNIPVAPYNPEKRMPKTQGELSMFSVTRVVPIKKLETICKALSKFPIRSKVIFDIYGPVEDKEYCNYLLSLAEKIPHFKLNFKGSVLPSQLAEKTTQYHLFCLPSSNENFGHAIYEAFAAACPVLISDQTPWRNLQAEKAGFDLGVNDLQGFSEKLSFFAQIDNENWQEWSKGAYNFALKHYRKEEWAKAYLALFAGNE